MAKKEVLVIVTDDSGNNIGTVRKLYEGAWYGRANNRSSGAMMPSLAEARAMVAEEFAEAAEADRMHKQFS